LLRNASLAKVRVPVCMQCKILLLCVVCKGTCEGTPGACAGIYRLAELGQDAAKQFLAKVLCYASDERRPVRLDVTGAA
jgi:hypothetical protein